MSVEQDRRFGGNSSRSLSESGRQLCDLTKQHIMASNFSSSPSLPQHHHQQPLKHHGTEHDRTDQAVKSTADDAILAKLSCVENGYYDDPFIRAMSQGASGLVNRKRSNSGSCSRDSRYHHQGRGRHDVNSTEPIIRRGTHARVKAIERAIDAFLSLQLNPSKDSPNSSSSAAKQIVILGAGRDTTYLRYRSGNKDVINLEHTRWYEVDHPSIIVQKAHSWLSKCTPNGYEYNFDANNDTSTSYAVSFTPKSGEDDSSHGTSNQKNTSNYHLIGHDLRSPPSTLFDILTHRNHGYDRSLPTLFVLECVMMYLPDDASRGLLRYIADSPLPPSLADDASSSDPFVAVAMYDPIPSNDRFGKLMIENLQKAGITGRRQGHVRSTADDDDDTTLQQLSLEKTSTLTDQLTKLIQSGFDTAIGCDMMAAYDHGVISMEERRCAARCEMLDELEEFVLLMKHYCLVMGVSAKNRKGEGGNDVTTDNASVGFQLCSVGKDSPVGFQEGRCTICHFNSLH